MLAAFADVKLYSLVRHLENSETAKFVVSHSLYKIMHVNKHWFCSVNKSKIISHTLKNYHLHLGTCFNVSFIIIFSSSASCVPGLRGIPVPEL